MSHYPSTTAIVLALSAGPALGQVPQFVPNYQAPVQPGVANYVAPVQPGVSSYVAPVQPGVANYVAPVQPGVANYVAPISPGVGSYVAPTAGVPHHGYRYYSAASTGTTSTSHYTPAPSALTEGTLFGLHPEIPRRPANDIHVIVPDPNAKLTLNGEEMTGTGYSRHLAIDGVRAGAKHEFTLTATWKKNGKPVSKTQVIHLDGTGHALADFR